jgi:hypothetical protein
MWNHGRFAGKVNGWVWVWVSAIGAEPSRAVGYPLSGDAGLSSLDGLSERVFPSCRSWSCLRASVRAVGYPLIGDVGLSSLEGFSERVFASCRSCSCLRPSAKWTSSTPATPATPAI